MSAKWIRSKQWDDRYIPAWAWPAKALLRAFSSIPLAVVLLSLVAIYCTLASVPIGLLALAPTYALYAATLVAAIGAGAVLPVGMVRLIWRPVSQAGRSARFAVTLLGLLVLAALSARLWYLFAWPRLHYDPAYATGVRLFADFAREWESTTLRRMPWLEMSELEFYSWWPLRVVLTLFVINMIVATVRRIEFTVPNLGVLTVHTGIVVMALGSMYYGVLKQEGDTLLTGGEPSADGRPTIGPPQSGFYDNTKVVLWARQDGRFWEQRPIRAPRYNDYNLMAGMEETALVRVGRDERAASDGGRKLDEPIVAPSEKSQIDDDIRFRLVGYASYAEPVLDFAKAEPREGEKLRPVRFAELLTYHDQQGRPSERAMTFPFYFLPGEPAHRLAETDVFALEYVRGMSATQFGDLTAEIPEGSRHALVIHVPGDGDDFRGVYAARTGDEIIAGGTGYRVVVEDLLPRPPFPIITPGYQNAESSVAIVRITTPENESYQRWIYHRYPEISQDMLDGVTADGRQMRRAADPGIRITYIDASKLQIYVDEAAEGPRAGSKQLAHPTRAIVRQAGQSRARVEAGLGAGDLLADVIEGLHVRFGERWAHAERVERPRIVPPQARQNDEIGNHMRAMLAVEVSTKDWDQILWLPFTKYLGVGLGTERDLQLPDGRRLQLAFGRLRYPLPGFMVQLVDFQMVAYDHRGAPRDYQSRVRVAPHRFEDVPGSPIQVLVERLTGGFEPYEHITKLNAPLQAPFMWADDRGWLRNMGGLLLSRLNPQQFKFSQAGWDAEGWKQTQARVDRGELRRPYAQFTILGVGNNPGIHIIALGGILMSIGIPWAFYIKPLIMQRRKRRLQAQIAAGVYERPGTTRQEQRREPVGVGAP